MPGSIIGECPSRRRASAGYSPGLPPQLPNGMKYDLCKVRHPRDLLQDMAPVYSRHPHGHPALGAEVLVTYYGAVPAGGIHGGYKPGFFLIKVSS